MYAFISVPPPTAYLPCSCRAPETQLLPCARSLCGAGIPGSARGSLKTRVSGLMDLFLRFPPNTSEAAHFTAISRQKIQFYTSFDTKINMAALKGEMTQREAHTPPPHLPTQGKKCVYRVVAVSWQRHFQLTQ